MQTADDVRDVIVMTGASVLGAWLAEALREVGPLCDPAVEIVVGHRDDPAPEPGRVGGAPRLLLMASADRTLMEVMEGRGVPVVAVLDDPVDSVRFLRVEKALDFLHAMREQTRNAASNHTLCNNPAALLVERGMSASAREVLTTVLRHAGLAPREEALEGWLERFAGPPDPVWPLEQALAERGRHYVSLRELRNHVSADEATIIRQVLSPVVLAALTPDIGPITWTARTLLSGDQPDTVAPPVAEVTGAARVLLYGPYFHLPPGEWIVRVILGFSPESRGTTFELTVFSRETVIAKALLRPESGGAFEGSFAMRHVAPEQHIEIHFRNAEGTIEGHVAFGQMIFTRQRPLRLTAQSEP